MYSIGLDIGTTSVCGIIHNAKTGDIIRSFTLENDSFIQTENKWEKIQDADRLLSLVDKVLNQLLSEKLPVVSIGITGQMHGIVYINENGKAVSPLKIWQDGRGDLPYKDGKTYAEYMSKITGYKLATGYGAVTYFYDSVNCNVPENAVGFCTIHDLAAMHFTGSTKPLLHSSDAASLGLFDIEKNEYNKTAVEKLGLDYSFFPKSSADFKVMGNFKGIPVSIAIGDNQASFIGSVSDMEKSILVNVGTGSQISCLTESIPDNKALDCRPLMKNSYILAGSSLCGGRAYAMLERLFREIASVVSGEEIKSAYPAMDKIMEKYDNLANGLEVSTLFSGTRSNPRERGYIRNIGTDNFSMAFICDGFMQGIVNEMYDMYSDLKLELSSEKNVMVGSGNGIRNNMALRHRFEQTFGMKMIIPSHKEEAAFGASLFALVASEIYDSINTASRLIKYEG